MMVKIKKQHVNMHIFRILALLLGIVIFYYSIEYYGGFAAIVNQLADLPASVYLWVVLISLTWTVGYTQAWRLLMAEKRDVISFLSLFKVKVCGEAVNLMTPAGFIVGDPIRVLLLKKYVGPQARLRSVVVDRALHSLAAQFFCFVGLLFLFLENVNFPLWLHLSLLFIYLFVFWFIASLVLAMLSGKGLGSFEKLFRWLKISKRLPRFHEKILELKQELSFYKNKPKWPFFSSFLYHFWGRVLGAIEIAVILYFLTDQLLMSFSIILTALTSFVAVVGGFVPGAMGFLETLYAAFTDLYGYDPAMGLTVQIIRRLRILFWIAVGILILDYGEIVNYIRYSRNGRK